MLRRLCGWVDEELKKGDEDEDEDVNADADEDVHVYLV